MKKILSALTFIFLGLATWAQAPNAVNYQGVARDASGTPLANATLGLRLTVHSNSSSGATAYQETQTAQTNSFGLYNVAIGTGSATSGSFSGINWTTGTKYLQVEIDPAGGSNYTSVGSAQLLSAPYAIFSNTSGSTNALNGNNVSTTAPTSGQVLAWNGSSWAPSTNAGSGIGGSGSAGYIPEFTSASGLGNSTMYQTAGGQVAIGTTTPQATLHTQSATDSMAGYFTTTSSTEPDFGVVRVEYNGSAAGGAAVIGSALETSGTTTTGMLGGGNYAGLEGIAQSSTAVSNFGVIGQSATDGSTSIAVGGFANGYQFGPSTEICIYGNSVDATLPGTATYAGYFDGDVYVNGTLSKAGGTFKIDDPMDPANKYLNHSFVESPDMMNVYNGNIMTDANGEATVKLPAYFEAENKDFRYQLTVIGTFAQAIVSQEVAGNQFVIKTSVPNVKVSWQVTGVRQDAWANAHRVVAETDKEPFNKGKYLNAKELGKPATTQIMMVKPNTIDKKVLATHGDVKK